MKEFKYWAKLAVRSRKPSFLRWYFHWRDSLNGKRTPLSDGLPWIAYAAIDWLSSHLTPEMTLFEWGAGGSTVFFSRHVKQVVSIEHDPIWYEEISAIITKNAFNNVNLNLVKPEISNDINFWHMSTVKDYQGFSFEKYVRAIDTYPDNSFDVVFVDGRARPGCIRQAIPKIKTGGYLILDDSEREGYAIGLNLIPKNKDIRLSGPVPYVGWSKETRIMEVQK
ncbi:hypothetical protein BROC_02451 [Candidatus Brocadiaceae bacterium]|nr:hypothetical protein BROC_02451 [Candidatus Brocadiaceae bacterium]